MDVKKSPAAKLALLIERIVRKVVREELQALNEIKTPSITGHDILEGILPSNPRKAAIPPTVKKLPPVVAKLAQGNSMLEEIFRTTTPFGRDEVIESPDADPMSLMAEGWSTPSGPIEEADNDVVNIPGLDAATSHIANIMNKTNFKEILERSKSFDRH